MIGQASTSLRMVTYGSGVEQIKQSNGRRAIRRSDQHRFSYQLDQPRNQLLKLLWKFHVVCLSFIRSFVEDSSPYQTQNLQQAMLSMSILFLISLYLVYSFFYSILHDLHFSVVGVIAIQQLQARIYVENSPLDSQEIKYD